MGNNLSVLLFLCRGCRGRFISTTHVSKYSRCLGLFISVAFIVGVRLLTESSRNSKMVCTKRFWLFRCDSLAGGGIEICIAATGIWGNDWRFPGHTENDIIEWRMQPSENNKGHSPIRDFWRTWLPLATIFDFLFTTVFVFRFIVKENGRNDGNGWRLLPGRGFGSTCGRWTGEH